MKNFFQAFLTVFAIVTVLFSAYYALNFKASDVVSVQEQEYATGNFSFTGNLRAGLFDGDGKLNYQNGDRYEGGFKEGRFQGQGTFFGREDWRFEGEFETGKLKQGTFFSEDGTSVRIERGEKITEDTFEGADWKYIGAFDARGQEGNGTFVFPDGSTYVGTFSRGVAEGTGIYTDASGQKIYEGEFKEGLFDGEGAYFGKDGWVYAGAFKSGLFDGEGAVTIKGETVHGAWEKGKQVKRYE
ncbi:hypothetical protein FACS1894111_04910 [Clostridia bacterium]|nr:hypothetical protein FACS1894111_04910 [Clostridia bacterium]